MSRMSGHHKCQTGVFWFLTPKPAPTIIAFNHQQSFKNIQVFMASVKKALEDITLESF